METNTKQLRNNPTVNKLQREFQLQEIINRVKENTTLCFSISGKPRLSRNEEIELLR